VDHDPVDEPQHDHEALGFRRIVGIPADEGDTIFVDHHSGPNRCEIPFPDLPVGEGAPVLCALSGVEAADHGNDARLWVINMCASKLRDLSGGV
jgi:hypothetical protein